MLLVFFVSWSTAREQHCSVVVDETVLAQPLDAVPLRPWHGISSLMELFVASSPIVDDRQSVGGR